MNLFHKLLDLIYPPRCMFCHGFLKGKEQGMCSSCRASLPVLAERDRVQSLAGVSACSSLFRYEGNVRQSLHRYKFRGLSYYGSEFAAMMAVYMTDSELACDIVTWVPLSRARMRSRGYDQAGLIAAALANNMGVPCRALLVKKRNTAPQSGSGGRKARKRNIRNAYRLRENEQIAGKTILLIDDIVTTGATLEECAAVLSAGGAACIKAATIARTDRTD